MDQGDDINTTLLTATTGKNGRLLLLANLAPAVNDPDNIESLVVDFDPGTQEADVVHEHAGWLTSMVQDEQGRLLAVSADGELVELVSPAPTVRDLGWSDGLNNLCVVPGAGVLAVGNAGAVVRLATPASPPVFVNAKVDFYEAAAWSAMAMVAVGDEGHVLYGDGSAWRPISVPTNVCLYSATMLGPSHFFVGGEGGTLMEFDPRGIAEIDLSRDLTVYAMTLFKGKLHVATGDSGIWRLNGRDSHEQVSQESIYSLFDVNGVLVALGNNVIQTFDGTKWTRNSIDF